MLDVLLLFSSICTAVVVGASQTITGYRGQRVEIRCSYESGYETNSKYFCKGECNYGGYKYIMVKSGSPDKDERFSLTDDTTARVFTVTITDLRTEDEGKYWCAVEKPLNLPDEYSEIMLLIKERSVSVSISPSGVIVEGDSVTLNCISDSNPPALNFSWFKGGTFVGSGRIYNISKISSDDSGEYKCKSINEHGEKYSDTVTLKIMIYGL